MLISKLKPHGFVLAAGLLPLVSKTASHVFECLLRRGGLAPIRCGEPLCKNCCQGANLTNTNFENDLPNPINLDILKIQNVEVAYLCDVEDGTIQ